MKQILYIGDINVDVIMGGLESFPVVDREITCTRFEVTMGSTAVIGACTFAALGGHAAFLGLAGLDDYGEFMLSGMRKFGVDVSRVRRTDAVRTGVTVNLIHARTRSQITYPGTIAAFDGADVTPAVFEGSRHAHFAGPYLQARFRPHITRLLEAARDAGVTTSLDPQWDAGETWTYMDEWLPLLTYFFCNADEAMSITGTATPTAAGHALAQQTACPLVKLGRAGVLAMREGRPQTIPTYRAEVVDTTGAGDVFAAAFLFAVMERGADIVAAAAFGNAAAARSCTFVGGVTARSTAEDVTVFMGREHERI